MRIENENAREYYMIGTSKQNWSTRQLERNINCYVSAIMEKLQETAFENAPLIGTLSQVANFTNIVYLILFYWIFDF